VEKSAFWMILGMVWCCIFVVLLTVLEGCGDSEPRKEYYYDCHKRWNDPTTKQHAREYELACISEHAKWNCDHYIKERFCVYKEKKKVTSNAKPN